MLGKQCNNCGRRLDYFIEPEDLSIAYISNELRKSEDWLFMLSHKEIFQKHDGFSIMESLTITYLYFISLQDDITNIPIPHFIDFYNCQISSLAKKKINKNRNITPLNLLRTLRYYKISLKEFSAIDVPKSFLDTIKRNGNSEGDKYELGKCPAPWCKGDDDSSTLIKLNQRRIKYTKTTYCTKCSLTYGYNRESQAWENTDGIIETYYTLLPYLKELSDLESLFYKEIELDDNILNKTIGYSLNNSLIQNELYRPTHINSKQGILKNLLLKSKNVGKLKSLAKKDYNWNQLEFYYIYYTKEIQEHIQFLIDESKNQETKTKDKWRSKINEAITQLINEDNDISIGVVANLIGCNIKTIKVNCLTQFILEAKINQFKMRHLRQEKELKPIFDQYLNECLYENIKPTCMEVYTLLGVTKITISKNYPDLYEYIKYKISIANRLLYETIIMKYKNLCGLAIREITERGESLSYCKILKKAGLQEYYCRSYPDLRTYIDYEISKLAKVN
ncbi:hypothetical protein ACOI1C_14710 [Bacillus sp. DJP31]|uniref:hypothetical protein n=1 Tax=Bacillus sp. DJP31 TaxID=3409789 RepID=UPI003BB4BD79